MPLRRRRTIADVLSEGLIDYGNQYLPYQQYKSAQEQSAADRRRRLALEDQSQTDRMMGREWDTIQTNRADRRYQSNLARQLAKDEQAYTNDMMDREWRATTNAQDERYRNAMLRIAQQKAGQTNKPPSASSVAQSRLLGQDIRETNVNRLSSDVMGILSQINPKMYNDAVVNKRLPSTDQSFLRSLLASDEFMREEDKPYWFTGDYKSIDPTGMAKLDTLSAYQGTPVSTIAQQLQNTGNFDIRSVMGGGQTQTSSPIDFPLPQAPVKRQPPANDGSYTDAEYKEFLRKWYAGKIK